MTSPATPLRVIVFPGGANLPLWVAEDRGFNAREGIAVALTPTPNSVTQIRALMAGTQDIGLSAFDNVLAYQEGQGEVALETVPDLFAFMAFSRGTLRLVARPEIRDYADLRGRQIGVDALATGYSLALVKMLQLGGLSPQDYSLVPVGGTATRAEQLMEGRFAATMITSPLELRPEAQGCRRLANALEVLGPYQTITGVARRAWAAAHRSTLVAFIRAQLNALAWLFEPAHRAEAVVIYRRRLPEVPAAAAERALAVLLGEREGWVRDGRLERAAMATVLAIRSEFGMPRRTLGDPLRYIDTSYYEDAVQAKHQPSHQPERTEMAAEKSSIGWIGAGRMGYEMAGRLAKSGAEVTVWNRTRAKAEPLAQYGAKIADRLEQLAACDIVFCMVSTWDDVKQVIAGPGGLLSDAKKAPRMVIECSSISLEGSAELRRILAARGIDYLAAPVSGNAKVIKAGRLSFVCSGPRAAFDRAQPYLKMIAPAASYVGEGELARIVKICHNVFLGVVTQSLAEITVLANKAGVPRHAFLDFLNQSVMGSTFSRYKTPAFVNLDFKVTFTPHLLRKDLDLGLDAGKHFEVPMPLASMTRDILQSMIGRGMTEQDFATLLVQQAQASGMSLAPENVQVGDGLS